MENLRVSVVIVTRNRAHDVLRCLKSVTTQNHVSPEIIVVDNGSSDDTLSLLKSNYPNVIVLPQERNTGAPQGRNIGIARAQGELCFCMDDDAELIDPDTITKCVQYFYNDPLLACLSLHVLDQYDNIVIKLIPRRDRKILTEDTPGAMFSATGCMMRRAAFNDVGGFWEMLNPYFGEEPELSYRLLDRGYHILLTPKVAVRHYESLSERFNDRRLYNGVRNTPWFALRNLPWYAVITLSILTWGYFFLLALKNGQLAVFFRAIIASISGIPAVLRVRKPINKTAVQALSKYSGLLCW